MTVTAVRKSPEARTMTMEAEFDASAERIWQLWADPRQLERWWGPPTYPATFTAYEFRPGGRAEYHMTGPDGDQPRGYWEIVEVAAPRNLIFRHGLANDDGSPNTNVSAMVGRVTIEEIGGGRTRMTVHTEFARVEAMEQMLAMGMEEGLRQAMSQIDALLVEGPRRSA